MGVIETDIVFVPLAAFTLNPYEFLGVDVVPVMSGVGARVAATSSRGHNAGAIVLDAAEQDAAALVGMGFFAMPAEGVKVEAGKFQHLFRMQESKGRMEK